MSNTPYSELKKGTFLIASPDIEEGIFYRSVVLLCDHSPVGSFGLIINKPVELDHSEEGHFEMRVGGPNQPNQMILLQNQGINGENSLEICEGIYLNGDAEINEEENIPSTLLCLGYSGWASGVLEREFLNGAWFLCAANSHHLFETPAECLWQTLLREMGGKYKTLSLLPENLDLN